MGIFLLSLSNTMFSQGSTQHFSFTYQDRSSLIADGWEFIATGASGTARNTEQTTGTVVSYDQTVHPGVLRIPTDVGDLWGNANNTRNSLFRDLPADWSSIRMMVSSFSPSQNYQQAGLVAYENDDNYVQLTRTYEYGNKVTLVRETQGSAWAVSTVNEEATSNIYYRIDRNLDTDVLTSFYSLDGSNWTQVGGNVGQSIENPQLAIIVGASPGGYPNADVAWVEVIAGNGSATSPSIVLSSNTLAFTSIEGSDPADQTVTLSSGTSDPYTWSATVSGGATWLSVTPATGTSGANLTVSPSSIGLAAGTYTGSVSISSAEATNSPQSISVTYTVQPADQPFLELSASTLNFSGPENGSSPASQSFNITNTGSSDVITWSATSSTSWITLSAASGSTPSSVSVTVDQTGLIPGNYAGTITVSSAEASNSPRIISVNLTVEAVPVPVLSLSSSSLSFVAVQGGPVPGAQSVSVSNSGTSDEITWSASPDAAWLSVANGSGTTPSSVNVSVDHSSLTAGNYSGNITFTSPEASNTAVIVVNFTVNPSGTQRYNFSYNDRSSLLAAGWNFLATTSGGSVRNTEQTSGTVVSYDQAVHPGVLRIPTDVGDLWGSANNTRNSLFRTLPEDWSSIRMLVTSFDPSQNYQQAGLVAYENDDNYVQITRTYEYGNKITLVRETQGSAWAVSTVNETATSNIHYRIDRNTDTGILTTYYSLDGANWVQVGGNINQEISNPRVAVVVGASPGGYPEADIAWVEVIAGSTTSSASMVPSASAFTFNSVEGVDPASQQLVMGAGSVDTYTWTATPDAGASWLSVTPAAGSSGDTITLNVSSLGLTAGTYSGTITLTSPEAVNSPQVVSVTYTVAQGDQPLLTVSGSSLSFTAVSGGAVPSAQNITVSNTGTSDVLTWSVISDATWLTVSPSSGSTPGTIAVLADQSGLSSGTYNGTITVSSAGVSNSPLQVAVAFTVQAPQAAEISISPSEVSFSVIENGLAAEGRDITISNIGNSDAVSWSGFSDANWLSLSVADGTTPSVTQILVDQTGLAAGTYNGNITVEALDASNQYTSVAVRMIVNPEGMQHIDLNYSSRTALLADGWDFNASTSGGSVRNTEQLSGAVVSYDQSSHPGVIRIPVDQGDLWGSANDTRNSIFRDLPSTWTTVRMRLSAFDPSQNYQQAGFVIYDNDDNYVHLTRAYEYGNHVTFINEITGSAQSVGSVTENATSSVYLQLVRDHFTETITATYSLDGTNWTSVGPGVVHVFSNPRVGIVSGGSPSGYPVCDVSWIEIESGIVDELRAYPNNLTFHAIEGQASDFHRVLNLSTTLGQVIDWTLTSDVSWIQASLTSGQTDATVTVDALPAGLAAGVYTGTISITAPQSIEAVVSIPVSLIVNPNVGIIATNWMGGKRGAMSVSVDDGAYSGFDELVANGFSGTFVSNGSEPPSYFTNMYNSGMELGAHLYSHICQYWDDEVLRNQEIEQNINGISATTPQPAADLITMVWPCGVNNIKGQSVAAEYFLASRGYNFNTFEETTPDNFMNLKSFNSFDDFVLPPPTSDFISLVDSAIHLGKWYNLVLHFITNDFGAIQYARSMEDSIWVSSIGDVVKYIMQRNRFILSDYALNGDTVIFNVSRLAVPASIYRSFETAFGTEDITTIQVDVDDFRTIESVTLDGSPLVYQTRNVGGNTVILLDVRLEPGIYKNIRIRYQNETLPRFYFNPQTLNFTSEEGVNPAGQNILMTLSGVGSVNWSASAVNGASWLSISPSSGTEQDTIITVSVSSAGISSGTFSETIAFASVDAANTPQNVQVNYILNPASVPTISVAPASLTFSAAVNGATPETQVLAISNSETADVLNWTVTADAAWLSVTPTSGTTPASIVIGIDQSSLATGIYTGTIRVSSAGAANLYQDIPVSLRVNPEGMQHIDFTYADRSAFIADGWDFIASTSAGVDRNTEQTTTAVVSFDQTVHPGVVRIPLDLGDMWGTANDTRNTLFRDLPTAWTSVSMLVNSFNPTQNYQQAGLMVYGNDDNYVQVTRIYSSGNLMTFAREVLGTAWVEQSVTENAATGLYYRIDRNPANDSIRVYYSLDGSSWTQLGNGITQAIANPRLAIVTGTSPSGYPNADIAWVEITSQVVNEMTVSPATLSFTASQGSNPANQSVSLTTSGSGTFNWTVSAASGSTWLGYTPVAGTGEGTVTVSVNTASLAAGTYNDVLTFTSAEATNSPQTVPVSLEVLAVTQPTLDVSSANVSFSMTAGDVLPAPVSVQVTNNTTSDVINWTSSSSVAWIGLSAAAGTTPGSIDISIDTTGLSAGVYSGIVTLASAEAVNGSTTVGVTFNINPEGTTRYNFSYGDQASLLADGWDFIARTLAGADRNTEQTTGAIVSYDQTTHPGILRIPVDEGDLWGSANSTRNSLFRDLPENWVSIRLMIAAFNPTQNYQQAGLVLYDNDDSYVQLTRIYSSSNLLTLAEESQGAAWIEGSVSMADTTNLHYRIDKDQLTDTITAYYSLDGANWVQIGGGISHPMISPQLAIVAGSSSSGFPNADIAWAEVITADPVAYPTLAVSPAQMVYSATVGDPAPASQILNITNSGNSSVLNWTLSESISWLSTSLTQGTTPATVAVSVDHTSLTEGSYTGAITLTSAEAVNSPVTLNVTLTVKGQSNLHIDFNYTSRDSLLADGWDFIALTSTGAERNTEQLSGAVVSYDQITHPGVIRIPLDAGDLWASMNNTRNSLFRDLPADWVSIRLMIAAFAPSQSYQQAGLLVYQNDDNYLQITRNYAYGNYMTYAREQLGSAWVELSVSESATSNLYYRIDRDPDTETLTVFYSLNGTTWNQVGNSVVQVISNPRMAIVAGSSPGGYPNADIAWAEIYADTSNLKAARVGHSGGIFAATNPTAPEFGSGTRLYPNYPNPFTDFTWIEFEIDTDKEVSLEVYDSFGKKINILANNNFRQGRHKIRLEENYPPGTYYVVFKTDDFVQTLPLYKVE